MKKADMELNERLTLAREKAGFSTATEAARALGIPYPTYAGHENGTSPFPAKKGEQYARRFKVRFEWLMTGRGPMVDLATKYQDVLVMFDKLPSDVQNSYIDVLRSAVAPYLEQESDPDRAPEASKANQRTDPAAE